MQIDAPFPGGNIVVEKIEGNTAWIRQDLRDTDGSWFYWAFHVHLAPQPAAASPTLRFQFTAGDVIGTRGPCVSVDGGRQWFWLGREAVKDHAFTFTVPPGLTDLHFSMALPYHERHLREFLAARLPKAHLRAETLCTDRSGRPIERLRLGCLDAPPTLRLLLTARHHCCETTPNFALEGLIDAALGPDELGRWFRSHVEAWIIPFVDKDGVEAGDQGKNRRPHDHNRDYAGAPSLYPAVRALREQVPAWLQGVRCAALDLHCPGIRGNWHEHIYFVGTDNAAHWHQVSAYCAILEKVRRAPLPYQAKDNLPFGVAWNTGSPPGLLSCVRWAQTLPEIQLAATVEIPYANCKDVTVTPEAARAFGRDLLVALKEYLAPKG